MRMSPMVYIDSMSSVYPNRLAPLFRTIGSTYKRKRIRESGELYRSPPHGLAASDSSPLYVILISLSVTKELTQAISHYGQPYRWSRLRSFI